MKTALLGLSILFYSLAYAQETTTFILVRHAEKANDGTKDPDLTIEGKVRAQHLLKLLDKADISAIYSTDFKRTRNTVAPLAKNRNVDIQIYEWENPKALLTKIVESNIGGTVVISGHSNTTPILANLLLGTNKLEPFKEDDYGNIIIINTSKIGEGKLLLLRY